MQVPEATLQLLKAQGQEHLLRWWDDLNDQQQAALLKQIGEIDFNLLQQLLKQRSEATEVDDLVSEAVSPVELVRLAKAEEDRTQRRTAAERGWQQLREGRVGAILVAGGQGSRLGFDAPKGTFPIGPVSQRTLFHVLCEQLLAVSKRAGQTIPYFVMTSEATHEPTVEFFAEHDHFELGQENVYFFQQASLAAIDDASHKILMAEKGRLATSPDGHGGALSALARNGMYEVMRKRGIETLYYHQVDNPTAIVCDPELIGLHLEANSEMTTKVIAKLHPDEKMGCVVTVRGKTMIIEYSDLDSEQVRRTDAAGQPIFWAGSTAIHVFQREFLESLSGDISLPFHIAHKKVPCVQDDGEIFDPETPNAHKFEQFIFDALPHAKVALVVEGDRQREFNPVKNAEGADSPATSRAALNALAHLWITRAGCSVKEDVQIEISPLYAWDESELAQKLHAPREFTADTILK